MSAWTVLRARRAHRRAAAGTREALLARNLARFRRLARFAARRSPFYGRVVKERGIDLATARPEDFPVLTKEEYGREFDAIATHPRVRLAALEEFLLRSHRTGELFDGRFHVLHSSGTSGTVSYAVYSRREWLYGVARYTEWVGLRPRNRVAYVGAAGGHYGGASLATPPSGFLARYLYETRIFDGNDPVDGLVSGLNAFRPGVLVGYPRILAALAEHRRSGELDIAPRRIVCGGEPLLPRDREALQTAFGCSVRNVYSTSETLALGASHPHEPRMVLLEDDVWVEVRDDCLLVTNLYNYTVPLIRYRVDDVLRPLPGEAGRYGPYRAFSEYFGRDEEMIVFRSAEGKREFLHPVILVEVYAPHLREFQFQIVDETSFRFFADLVEGVDAAGRERAHQAIRKHLSALLAQKNLSNVRFEIEDVDSLRTDPRSGKFRLVL